MFAKVFGKALTDTRTLNRNYRMLLNFEINYLKNFWVSEEYLYHF